MTTTFGFVTTTFGSVQWQGGLWDGEGAISTKSGALTDYPYGFASRFEGKPGSNRLASTAWTTRSGVA